MIDEKIEIPFNHGKKLVICIAARSMLIRSKLNQALTEKVANIFDTDDLDMMAKFLESFTPRVVFLDLKVFCSDEFHEAISKINKFDRPKVILVGSPYELEQDIAAQGVHGLLATPFLPEMVLLKINSVLQPNKNWSEETRKVLAKMRKYQRFSVENVVIYFHKPVQERTVVLDISWQGLKAKSELINEELLGEEFQMQMSCDGGGYIIIRGKAQWCRDGCVGIRFISPKPDGFPDFFKKVLALAVSPVEN